MDKIPCNPEIANTDMCRVYRKVGKCFMDIHHKNYPKSNYTTEVEKDFRELDQEKEFTCRQRHNDIHHEVRATEKPPLQDMVVAVNSLTLAAKMKSAFAKK